MDGHGRFERMAVGHVLGGLDEVDGAAFRAHLLGCPDCRKRVNELRDIASDLAETERQERRAASLAAAAVEVETRTTDDAPEAAEVAPVRRWPWGVVVIGLVPLLVLGTLAWAVWQRAQTDITAAVAASQQQVLEVLATGAAVDFTTPRDEVDGNIAVDGETVAVNLTGIPELRPNEGLVVWLLDAEGTVRNSTRPYLRSQVDGRLVAVMSQPPDATEVLVTMEPDLTDLDEPAGYRLLTGAIETAADAGDGSDG